MIISHKNRFIFIKTIKTAGTSIEIALSKYCGGEDIITPISPEDEAVREDLGYPGPSNYKIKVKRTGIASLLAPMIGKKFNFYNHIDAASIRAIIGPDVWDKYYKFCFARNPMDRAVSLYWWRYQRGLRVDISDFIQSDEILAIKSGGYDLYSINGVPAVDRVCRYENLQDELELVRAHLGLSEPLCLPQTKTGYRKDKRDYKDILSEGERSRIAAIAKEEIELMEYEFK